VRRHERIDGNLHWYALRTRSRHEKVVRDGLRKTGIDALLPTFFHTSYWKDRKKTIETPLFSGYCFARFSLDDRLRVLQLAGVADIVGFADRPQPVHEEEILALRKLADGRLSCRPYPYLAEGMAVRVVRGPLAGVHGMFVREGTSHRLVISVRLIQKSASIELDACDIVPLVSESAV